MLTAVSLVTICSLILAILVYVFSFLFVRYYIESRASKEVISAAFLAISVSMFSLILIPINILVISSDLTTYGTLHNPFMINEAGKGFQYLYNTFYCLLVIFAFFILPFAFFYLQDEDNFFVARSRKRHALKYTLVSATIFIVLLITGIKFKKSNHEISEGWIHDLGMSYNKADAILYFIIGTLSVIGLFGWVMYTAYGMALIPFKICKRKHDENAFGRFREDQNKLNTKWAINYENQRYISSSKINSDDANLLQQLKQEKQDLESIISKNEENGPSICHEHGKVFLWNILKAPRILFGVLLFVLSVLIAVSLFVSNLDKLLNSECRYSCGFSIPKNSLNGPIDAIFSSTSSIFPFDFILFVGIVAYIFASSLYGIASLGIRLCGFRLYKFVRRITFGHEMILGTWFLMCTILALNLEVVSIAPHYVTFAGNQYYYPLHPTVTLKSVPDAEVCTLLSSLETAGPNQCITTQISTFVNTLSTQLPIFGMALIFFNFLFIVAYVVFTVIVLFGWDKLTCMVSNDEDDLWNDM